MNGIVAALIGASGFGTANVVIKKSLEDVSIPQTLMMSTLSGLVILIGVVFFGGSSLEFSPVTLAFGFILAALEVTLYLVLYKTFEVSNVTVATAVSSTYPIFATLVTVFALSQSFQLNKFIFILWMVVGAVLTSIDWHGVFKDGLDKSDLVKGFGWIGLTTAIHALYFPLLGEFTSTGTWQSKLLLIKIFSAIIMFVFFYLITKQSVIPQKERLVFTSLLGLLEMIGWAGFSLANSNLTDSTAIVIGIMSSAPLVTAVLAYFFLNEKLSKVQYLGIFVIIASLTGLSL